MLEYYGLCGKYQELRDWYGGYRFGGRELYNPWNIINYVKAAEKRYAEFPKAYWPNTSSNSIIRELIEEEDDSTKAEIEALMAGETIEKPVYEEVAYIYERSIKDWFDKKIKQTDRTPLLRALEEEDCQRAGNGEIIYLHKKD